MGRCIPILVLFLVAIVVVGAAVAPSKISPQKNTTIYFGAHTFANTHYTDTLVWAKNRSFTDTSYTCAVFVSGKTTTGILKGRVLDDSSIIVASSVVTDSTLIYFYEVLLQKH